MAMDPGSQREADIKRGSVTDAGATPDAPTTPGAIPQEPTGIVGDAPRAPVPPGHGEVGTPDGIGDADGIGGTTGAVARE